jgi:putative nucleotidyltransferase with HDIG domain
LDIVGKNNLSHSKSTAYLAVIIGRELGLDEDEILKIYYAALLHDIGLGNTYEMIPHCTAGREILGKLPLPGGIAEGVYYHHEFFDGSGLFGLSGGNIPGISRIICFASAFDDAFGKLADGFDIHLFLRIKAWLDENRALFSPEIAGAFESLIGRECFLLDYFNHETKYTLSGKMVVGDDVSYEYEDIVKFAVCFADVIDRRSPFTYTHSRGIAGLARKAAARLGYDGETQNKMYIAGLLHDIGKLYISPDILHKNGKLTPEERFEINKHPYYTRKILEQVRGFEDIVAYAANHHEKIDGTGYPYRKPGAQLSELEKVMAICDVYQALTEERPYRAKLPEEKVWEIIFDMTEKGHLDKALADKTKRIFASV